jgi:general secretion pathway protein G
MAMEMTLGSRQALLARVRRLRKTRGVTLFEVLIVVAILAMVAGGVAVFALPRFQDSQKKTAEAGARTIRMAVQQWQAANNETSCPTVSQLIQDKQLDTGQNTNDPWGRPTRSTAATTRSPSRPTAPTRRRAARTTSRCPRRLLLRPNDQGARGECRTSFCLSPSGRCVRGVRVGA